MQRYETHTIEQPELPFIFNNDFSCNATHVSCICNWHENIELLAVTEGEGKVRVNEDTFPVQEGDVAVISTNQIHDIYSKTSMRYTCLIIDRSFFLQNYVDSNLLRFTSRIRDARLFALMKSFEQTYSADDSAPYRTLTLRSDALQILLLLCRDYSVSEPLQKTDKKIYATIKKVIGQIRAESNTSLSLDKIAKAEGWNKCYLAREFHRYTGQSMIAFLNTVRCEQAKKMLAASETSIGEVGRQCGFNDQTYFTRTFRAHTGKTPGEYRKAHRNKQ